MTTVVSRLYANKSAADAAAKSLSKAGFPDDAMDVIAGGADASVIAATRVSAKNAALYAQAVGAGHALLVARVPYQPQGLARRVKDTLAQHQSIYVEGANPNEYIRERMNDKYWNAVLKDHPRFLSYDMGPGFPRVRGPISHAFGMRLLSPHKTKRSAMSGTRYMSRMFWPMPLVKTPSSPKNSAMSGTRHMSRAFWPMKLVSSRA